jgi:hypothetical protein
LGFTDLTLGTSTILVALLGAFAYGCGDFMGGRAAVRLSPSGAVPLAQCAAALVTVQAFMNGGGGFLSPHVVASGPLGGAAYLIGLMNLYQGIAFARIAIVVPISGLVGIVELRKTTNHQHTMRPTGVVVSMDSVSDRPSGAIDKPIWPSRRLRPKSHRPPRQWSEDRHRNDRTGPRPVRPHRRPSHEYCDWPHTI